MLKTWFIKNRPQTLFDVTNAEHRQAYFEYRKHNSWQKCKYQFVIEDTYIDLPSMIDNKLVNYYLNNEFTTKKL